MDDYSCLPLPTSIFAIAQSFDYFQNPYFRYAKIAKISKLNYFYCSEYFFLKLHIQRLQVDSIRYSEFQEIFQKTESSRPHFLKMDHN